MSRASQNRKKNKKKGPGSKPSKSERAAKRERTRLQRESQFARRYEPEVPRGRFGHQWR